MHKRRFANACIRECVRWRNTSGGMTWAKTRIEMCFFSRRLPTRNYTRVPLSSTLAFFLSLVEFALARPATGKRIAAEWFIWPWWSRWWLVYGKGVLLAFFLTITLRNEIKFLEDIPAIYAMENSVVESRRFMLGGIFDIEIFSSLLLVEFWYRNSIFNLSLMQCVEFWSISSSRVEAFTNDLDSIIMIKFLKYFNIVRKLLFFSNNNGNLIFEFMWLEITSWMKSFNYRQSLSIFEIKISHFKISTLFPPTFF